jgi:hypothetical protein
MGSPNQPSRVQRIISGGQTGADQAGLEAAERLGIWRAVRKPAR